MEKTESQKLDAALYLGLYCALFFVTFTFSLTTMAAPYIVLDLGGSADQTAIYNVVFFGIGNAIGVPLGKPLAARLSSARALISCLLFLTLFTWGDAIAPTYPIMILFRFLQGVAGGPIYAILNHLLTSFTPKEKRPFTTSVFVTILASVPAAATCWGGFIAYEYDWRWIFTFNVPWMLLLAGLLHLKLRDCRVAPPKEPFDLCGFFFYVIGASSLLISATMAQQLDWYRSPLLVLLTLIGVPSFLFFLLWSWYHPHPIIHLRLLKNPVVSFALLNLGVLFGCYFGMITLIPQWLKLYAEYTPNWIAAIIGGMAIGAFFPNLLIEQKLRLDARWPLGAAIVFLAISSFHTTIFDTDINFGRIAFSRIIAGIGLALFLPPIFRLTFKKVTDDKLLDSITLFQAVRSFGCSLGAALFDICWQRRQVFFHERLGEQLTVNNQLTQNFFNKAKLLHVPGDPNALLGYFLDREANSLALDDTFWLIAWMLVGLLILLFITLFFNREPFAPDPKHE